MATSCLQIETNTYPLSHAINDLRVDRITQFFGAWAIEESRFRSLLTIVSATDLKQHVELNEGKKLSQGDQFETIAPGVALVRITGPMSKRGSSFNRGGGTVRARNEIRLARQAGVNAILLQVESPGGTVAGTKELADDIAAAVADGIRVVGFAEDLAASAAYWALSQASEVYANAPALVGSIGTFLVLDDLSRAFENAGVTVHVVKAGEMKAAGTAGTEITEDQLAYFQQLINETNELFLTAVTDGRGFNADQLAAVANGRVYLAAEAAALGLIDGVRTFDEVVSGLVNGTELKGEAMKSGLIDMSAVAGANGTKAEDEATPTENEGDQPAADETPTEANEENEGDDAASEGEETAGDESQVEQDDAPKTGEGEANDRVDLKQWGEIFGHAKAFEYYTQDKTLVEALSDYVGVLKTENVTLKKQLKAAQSCEPGEISSGTADKPESAPGFGAGFRKLADNSAATNN